MPVLIFTASGTFNPASFPDFPGFADKIECLGPGGNGAARVSTTRGGSGGGGGEYAAESGRIAITSTKSYTVGTGGSGTATSFPADSVTVTANAGGNATTTPTAGAAGTGSGNTVHFNGGAGFLTPTSTASGGGGGGAAGPHGAGSTATSNVGGAADNSTVSAPAAGNAGNTGTEWVTAGSGTGGSGFASGTNNGTAGGIAGGGGSGASDGGAGSTGGTGGRGVIILSYTAALGGTLSAPIVFPRPTHHPLARGLFYYRSPALDIQRNLPAESSIQVIVYPQPQHNVLAPGRLYYRAPAPILPPNLIPVESSIQVIVYPQPQHNVLAPGQFYYRQRDSLPSGAAVNFPTVTTTSGVGGFGPSVADTFVATASSGAAAALTSDPGATPAGTASSGAAAALTSDPGATPAGTASSATAASLGVVISDVLASIAATGASAAISNFGFGLVAGSSSANAANVAPQPAIGIPGVATSAGSAAIASQISDSLASGTGSGTAAAFGTSPNLIATAGAGVVEAFSAGGSPFIPLTGVAGTTSSAVLAIQSGAGLGSAVVSSNTTTFTVSLSLAVPFAAAAASATAGLLSILGGAFGSAAAVTGVGQFPQAPGFLPAESSTQVIVYPFPQHNVIRPGLLYYRQPARDTGNINVLLPAISAAASVGVFAPSSNLLLFAQATAGRGQFQAGNLFSAESSTQVIVYPQLQHNVIRPGLLYYRQPARDTGNINVLLPAISATSGVGVFAGSFFLSAQATAASAQPLSIQPTFNLSVSVTGTAAPLVNPLGLVGVSAPGGAAPVVAQQPVLVIINPIAAQGSVSTFGPLLHLGAVSVTATPEAFSAEIITYPLFGVSGAAAFAAISSLLSFALSAGTSSAGVAAFVPDPGKILGAITSNSAAIPFSVGPSNLAPVVAVSAASQIGTLTLALQYPLGPVIASAVAATFPLELDALFASVTGIAGSRGFASTPSAFLTAAISTAAGAAITSALLPSFVSAAGSGQANPFSSSGILTSVVATGNVGLPSLTPLVNLGRVSATGLGGVFGAELDAAFSNVTGIATAAPFTVIASTFVPAFATAAEGVFVPQAALAAITAAASAANAFFVPLLSQSLSPGTTLGATSLFVPASILGGVSGSIAARPFAVQAAVLEPIASALAAEGYFGGAPILGAVTALASEAQFVSYEMLGAISTTSAAGTFLDPNSFNVFQVSAQGSASFFGVTQFITPSLVGIGALAQAVPLTVLVTYPTHSILSSAIAHVEMGRRRKHFIYVQMPPTHFKADLS